MSDLFLATKNNPPTPNFPPQQGNPEFFFGEGSNDLQIGPNNDFTLVSNLTKTTQDVQKILLTEQGTNFVFPLYGSTLQTLIGTKLNPNTLSGNIQDTITTSLQILYLLTQNDTNLAQVVKTLYSLNVSIQSQTNAAALLTVIAQNGEEITTGVNIGTI